MHKNENSIEFKSVNKPLREISKIIIENAEFSMFFENAAFSIAATIIPKNM